MILYFFLLSYYLWIILKGFVLVTSRYAMVFTHLQGCHEEEIKHCFPGWYKTLAAVRRQLSRRSHGEGDKQSQRTAAAMPQDTRTHTDRAVLALTTLVLVAFMGADVEPTGITTPGVLPDGSHTPNGTGSVELPHVLKVMSPCTGEKENFCVNGVCSYDPELNTPSCTCPPNFTGVRCQHILMNSHSQENPEALIAIGAGVAVLLCCLAGAIYCCMKKRCKNTNQPYQICQPERAV